MRWEPIVKSAGPWAVVPNLVDYERTCAQFSWDTARRALDGLPAAAG